MSLLISGALMLVVGIASIETWRRCANVRFRWFCAGAGLWSVAVVVKLIVALLADEAVLAFLKSALPRGGYLLIGSAYLGSWSALCEIGAVVLAGERWKQLATDRDRAIAIGVGAGGFEAALLGCVVVVVALVDVLTTASLGVGAISTDPGALWLVGPVERIIAILCHVSTRLLALTGLAARRRPLVIAGFLLFALLDGLAGSFTWPAGSRRFHRGASSWRSPPWQSPASSSFAGVGSAEPIRRNGRYTPCTPPVQSLSFLPSTGPSEKTALNDLSSGE